MRLLVWLVQILFCNLKPYSVLGGGYNFLLYVGLRSCSHKLFSDMIVNYFPLEQCPFPDAIIVQSRVREIGLVFGNNNKM